jgi:cobalt/nickel transport system permease protein
MAHIPDGVLSAPVLIAGAVVSTGLLAFALRRVREEDLPRAAVLAAAFFVSSLISVPLGPSSVHLLLNGLMGMVLGWAAVPALFVGLLLQSIFFGHGGLVALGVNTANLSIPALACALLLRPMLVRMRLPEAPLSGDSVASLPESSSPSLSRRGFMVGFAGGALAVALTGALVVASLLLSGQAFAPAASVIGATFVPLALVEGLLTGVVIAFLLRVEPALLSTESSLDG